MFHNKTNWNHFNAAKSKLLGQLNAHNFVDSLFGSSNKPSLSLNVPKQIIVSNCNTDLSDIGGLKASSTASTYDYLQSSEYLKCVSIAVLFLFVYVFYNLPVYVF